MEMDDEDGVSIVKESVFGDIIITNCDTPAARKLSGFAGHSADNCPCPWCRCTLLETNKLSGYCIAGKLLLAIQSGTF